MSTPRSTRTTIGYYLLILAFFTFTAATGGGLYQLIAENPNWSADLPASLIAHRAASTISHAGYFFQTMVPVCILSFIAATILLRNRPQAANRWLLLALGGVLVAEAYTGLYFMPRNFILFLDPIEGVPDETIRRAASEWLSANYVRLVIILITWGLFLHAFTIVAAARMRN
ncbi:MAG: anthrone oxygenase family protein [Flavobacteriales bacterium]